MVQIPAGLNVFPPACRSRAILPTLVGLFVMFVVLTFLGFIGNERF